MPENYLQLGLVFMKMNDPDQAESNMRRAVELQPNEATFRFSLGVALETENKCDAARAEFARALEINPMFPRAEEQMTKCGSGDGDKGSGPAAGDSADSQAPSQLAPLSAQ